MQAAANPVVNFTKVPQELDHPDWELVLDYTDTQIYTRYGASNSEIIGFKTITYHTITARTLYHFLKDVNGAMETMNELFVLGEVLRTWETPFDKEGVLVRTSFEMPFPFANREFVHGQHGIQLDKDTFVVAYTPIEIPETAVQQGYVRCPVFVSGQRIQKMPNGLVRVEHLMTYELGGRVSPYIQDQWLKKAHTKAYVREWRNLHAYHFPCAITEIDYCRLSSVLKDALEQSDAWSVAKTIAEGTIRVGRLPYCPKNVYRTDTEIKAPLAQVVDVIADKSLDYLPQWNKEFIQGEILEVLEENDQKAAWLIRVHYKTPFFLKNREYIYYFSREWLSETEVLITYHSVKHHLEVPKGFIRALLHPSVHYCQALPNGNTLLKHLLATDLKGNLSNHQDMLLKGGLVQAHCRDIQNQHALFEQL